MILSSKIEDYELFDCGKCFLNKTRYEDMFLARMCQECQRKKKNTKKQYIIRRRNMRFTNSVKAEWLPDGRRMKLLEEISFIDRFGGVHTAYKGEEVDGASIPRFFWRLCGGPFSGRYRRASVIHDVLCVRKNLPCEIVHKLFYDMMLVDHVPEWKAKKMYQAVKLFGPKWDSDINFDSTCCPA